MIDESVLVQLGIGGILALMVLKEVFAFLSKQKNSKPRSKEDLLHRQVDDLWNWHNVSDTEGVKVWYVRKSLEVAIDKLNHNLDMQNELLQKMLTSVKDLRREVHDVEKALQKQR